MEKYNLFHLRDTTHSSWNYIRDMIFSDVHLFTLFDNAIANTMAVINSNSQRTTTTYIINSLLQTSKTKSSKWPRDKARSNTKELGRNGNWHVTCNWLVCFDIYPSPRTYQDLYVGRLLRQVSPCDLCGMGGQSAFFIFPHTSFFHA